MHDDYYGQSPAEHREVVAGLREKLNDVVDAVLEGRGEEGAEAGREGEQEDDAVTRNCTRQLVTSMHDAVSLVHRQMDGPFGQETERCSKHEEQEKMVLVGAAEVHYASFSCWGC